MAETYHVDTLDFNDTVKKNNEAVSLIKYGLYEQAITLLTNALTFNRKLLTKPSGDDKEQASLDQSQRTLEPQMTLDQCLIGSRDDSSLAWNDHEFGLSPYIYREGILMAQRPHISYQAIEIFSTIIIFNLALAHHLTASQDNATPWKLLRAYKLYNLALHLQRKEDPKNNCNVLFTLATVNNMAIIQFDIDESKISYVASFEYLLSIVLLLFARGEGYGCSLEGFHTNAISALTSLRECIAPAA